MYILIPPPKYIRIHILKFSSALIVVLGVIMTKYQQIHPDITLAAQQMFTCLFTYLWEPIYSTFKT